MDSREEIINHPLQHLDYFLEWGGKGWQHLMDDAFQDFTGTELRDQLVLEVGTRYGKMACLHALLGARVVGLDINRKSLAIAREEATKLNVADKTLFVQCGGDLAFVKVNAFDVVFSKSVLVLVPDLIRFLEEVKEKLKPGGKIIFLENAKGPWWMHRLRALRHRRWDYTKSRYFTSHEIEAVSDVFDEFVVKSLVYPPIVLMMGRKPKADNPRAVQSHIVEICPARSGPSLNSPLQQSP